MNCIELSAADARFLLESLGCRDTVLEEAMRDSDSLEERLELSAKTDKGIDLAHRLACFISMAEKEAKS